MEKMIRDRIAEYVLDERGEVLDTRIADHSELLSFYKQKVLEEANEVFSAPDMDNLLEELGDLQEVLAGLICYLGKAKEISMKRASKSIERGGFYDGVILNMKDGKC